MIIVILNFPKESYIFDQSGFDVLIIHKLTEDVKFLSQKLVCEIYLKKFKTNTILNNPIPIDKSSISLSHRNVQVPAY